VTVHAMSVTDRRHIDVHEAWLDREHPMPRRRQSGRQLIALICVGLFFLTPSIAWALGAQAAQFENRPLATFGDPRDGWTWLAGLPAWAADNLPFRDGAVQATEAVSRGIFGEPVPRTEPQFTESQPGSLSEPQSAPLSRELGPQLGPGTMAPAVPAAQAFPSVIEGRDGWLYLGADVSGACLPSRSLDDTLDSLRRLRNVVETSGRRFVLVVAPDKTTMVPEHLPAEYVGRDCSAQARDEFWRRVVAEAGAIDLRPTLGEIARRKGSPAYYPADTHWSQEGGLAMTYALADQVQAGITRTWQLAPAGLISWPDDISPLIGRSGEREIATYSLAPAG
ncbi:MAG: alginate O-acetyltransferase AlgX-related protein, partial [Pseudonocardiaceae bacterium]